MCKVMVSRQLLGGAAVLAGVSWGSLLLLVASQTPDTCRASQTPVEHLVVVVPGGGLNLDGQPTAWVRERLQKAASIHAARRDAGEMCHIVTLSGGTPHKPMPVDPKSGYQVFEAEASAQHLIRALNVPAEDIFEESWSLDTVANAYMLRSVHTDVAGWRRLLVITNEFHMERTQLIFKKVFSLEPQTLSGSYEVQFVEVPNTGVEGDILTARKEREGNSASTFRKNTAGILTMRQMHSFLFRDHNAYASKRLLNDRKPVDPKALATY